LGDLAIRVLNGEPANAIPVEELPLATIFDWRAMKRWNINFALLPERTEIRFLEMSFWEKYKWQLVGLLAVLVLQSLLIAVLSWQYLMRKRAEEEATLQSKSLQNSLSQIQRLSENLLSAQEDEQARIARELHDDLGQKMASLSIGISRIAKYFRYAKSGAKDEVMKLQNLSINIVEDLRRFTHSLHFGTVGTEDVTATIESQCRTFSSETRIPAKLIVVESPGSLSSQMCTAIVRIAQEAMHNIAKHSGASSVVITLIGKVETVELHISDNGTGIKPEELRSLRGLGIVSMRERARILGGRLEITSQADGGTLVTAIIPRGRAS
jgi:signal transduction histidine kinase